MHVYGTGYCCLVRVLMCVPSIEMFVSTCVGDFYSTARSGSHDVVFWNLSDFLFVKDSRNCSIWIFSLSIWHEGAQPWDRTSLGEAIHIIQGVQSGVGCSFLIF